MAAFAGPIDVVLEDGAVTSARSAGGPAPDGAVLTAGWLFDAIGEALAGGIERVVAYHAELGDPLTVELDLEAIARDGGLSLEVLELTPAE